MKRPNHRVVICVRRDVHPSEVMKIYLIVLKVVACLACWCRGKTFSSPSKYCLSTLMTFKIQISLETSDILLTYTWVCRGLDGSTCPESLPERTCDFEAPEHVPRTSARAQTCVRGPGGLPACHGAESTRKHLRPEEKQMPKGKKNTFMYMYTSFPFGMCVT